MPIVHAAGQLQADLFPFASQTRTFQKTGCDDFNGRPAEGI
jgi:hypothetical protein